MANIQTQVNRHLRFSHLTVEDGLSHNVTNNIVQDPWGFIWISTFDGLNRFDGYEIKAFRHDPDSPQSLGSNFIRALTIDADGFIWLATVDGLNKFDPRTETVVHYQHQAHNPNSLGFDFVTALFIDQDGLIWIGGLGAVDQFDPQAETFVHFHHDPNASNTIGPGQVHSIHQDQQGMLWFGNRGGGGLSRFNAQQQCFVRYMHNPDDPHSLSDDSVHVIAIDREGGLWIGTENGGLNYFDRATQTFRHYQHNTDDPHSLSSNYVRHILHDQTGQLWIATAEGLNQMLPTGDRFIHHRHNPADASTISSDNTSRLFEDRAGGLWLSTFRGVNYRYPRYQQFRQYRHNPDDPDSLDNNSVRIIYEDTAGALWVGTENGLNRLDTMREKITRFHHEPNDPNALSAYLYITAIAEDEDGTLWIGPWGGELNCFDPQSGQFWRPGDAAQCPRISDIHALCCDHNGDIWASDYYHGLYHFRRTINEVGKCTWKNIAHYAHNPEDPHSLAANTIKVVYEDREHTLWVGTHTGGLCRLNHATQSFVRYTHDSQVATSISNNWIETIFQDRAGNLWVGTYNGLNRFNQKSETFKRYSERDGLPNTTVTSILEDEGNSDNKGHTLWLSTNQGLVKFDPQTETFQSYGAAEGLQPSSEVSGGLRSSSGEMFFGGYGGLTAFYPEQIISNQNVPPVVITNFLLFNKAVPIGENSPLQQATWITNEIALSDQEYSFAFEFAALSYVEPNKNRYKYKLEGFDRDWYEVDSRRRYAAYSNLPAGDYVFRVIGSNNHGVWNTQGAAIALTIAQPWWEKLRLEKESAEASNRAKSAFLANMSHELRTPLNAVLGFSELMTHDPNLTHEQRENLEIIGRSGEHLLALINDALELSKIEAGHTDLHPVILDLHKLLLGLGEMFSLRAQEKGLTMVFNFAPDVPRYIRADANKLRQVLINLLSNAVKFTQTGGITLKASVIPRKNINTSLQPEETGRQ